MYDGFLIMLVITLFGLRSCGVCPHNE